MFGRGRWSARSCWETHSNLTLGCASLFSESLFPSCNQSSYASSFHLLPVWEVSHVDSRFFKACIIKTLDSTWRIPTTALCLSFSSHRQWHLYSLLYRQTFAVKPVKRPPPSPSSKPLLPYNDPVSLVVINKYVINISKILPLPPTFLWPPVKGFIKQFYLSLKTTY